MNYNKPLVSVGIPTFNKPSGLYRTLKCITQQTFKELEIIVSDNCSTDPEVSKVIQEFLAIDSRIIYFRQPENLGAILNFKFVLEKATGEYFMWAADDDEWHESFISKCIENIGDRTSAFSHYMVLNRHKNEIKKHRIYSEEFNNSIYNQAYQFIKAPESPLIYAIHKRIDILWILRKNYNFDWFDCSFILKNILHKKGYNIFQEYLFTSGIDTPEYIIKSSNNKGVTGLKYFPYWYENSKIILKSQSIDFIQKITLVNLNILSSLKLFLSFGGKHKLYRCLKSILELVRKILSRFIR